MVVSETRGHGRFFALRLGVMVALVLTFGMFSQIVALLAIFGFAGPAYTLAALVVVNASAQLLTGVQHRQRTHQTGTLAWMFRAITQELVLVGGLIAIGLGHRDPGWYAAFAYLLWTGFENGFKYRRAEIAPRRGMRRRWTEAESRVRQAEDAIELAESIMVSSPDDEDIQSAAQQLRQAAIVIRQETLEGLRETRSAEVQVRAYNRARLRAALDDLEHAPPPDIGSEPHPAEPGDPWDGVLSDRRNT